MPDFSGGPYHFCYWCVSSIIGSFRSEFFLYINVYFYIYLLIPILSWKIIRFHFSVRLQLVTVFTAVNTVWNGVYRIQTWKLFNTWRTLFTNDWLCSKKIFYFWGSVCWTISKIVELWIDRNTQSMFTSGCTQYRPRVTSLVVQKRHLTSVFKAQYWQG